MFCGFLFNLRRFNILDQFMLSQGLFDKSVESVYTVHDVDNLSDHEPLFLVIQLVTDLITVTKRVTNDKVAWHKANEDRLSAYQVALANNLAALSVPIDAILCRDVCCTNNSHLCAIGEYSESISIACIGAVSACLPHTTVAPSQVYLGG